MSVLTQLTRVTAIVLVVAGLAAGCGGSDSPTAPSGGGGTGGGGTGGGGTGGGGSTNTTTITINASGVVTPNDITVSLGTRVTFVNSHNRAHEMNSDPHPTHGDCPPIDDVGFIAPGQTKLTGNMNTVGVCGFHDHNDPSNPSLQGRIRVQ
jgi:plastocyanin